MLWRFGFGTVSLTLRIPPSQTGLTQQDVQVSTVTFFVDILVTLEGVFALNTAQQSTLIGVRHDNSCPKPLE